MVYKYFGFDKLFKVPTIIAENGGIIQSLYKIYRQDALKVGTLVGTDKYGNKYFQNTYYFFGRSRWIEYSPHYGLYTNLFWCSFLYKNILGLEYDGSQIPAEWYGWMHYKTDCLPHEHSARPKHTWMADHTENLTGTPQQYMPYSTTKQKIQPWKPFTVENKEC